MHSKQALDMYYSGIENILPYYYGTQMPSDFNNNSQEQQQFQQSLEIVDSLNITKVMKDTMSLFWVKACRYQKRNCHDSWRVVLTMYGYCLQLIPEEPTPSANISKEEMDIEGDGGSNTVVKHIVF